MDTDTDRNHCGTCDNACGAGEICDGAGQCALSCQGGLTECDGVCVDTDSDRLHCGDCSTTCDSGEVCSAGSCATSCQGALVECGGTCIDPQSDHDYCGASGDCTGANAGLTCAADEACVSGTCLALDPCELNTPGTPGVTIGAPVGLLVEGSAPVTYEVSLDATPCDHVVVHLDPSSDLTLSATQLVFVPEDWATPQTVAVTAMDEFVAEGTHAATVLHSVTSHDVRYDGISVAPAYFSVHETPLLVHVSVPLPGLSSDLDSDFPVVSDDGRWVAFQSDATGLVSNDASGFKDVFLRDTAMGTTTRISEGLLWEADGASARPAISVDGNRLVFFSRATNLVTDSITNAGEVYLYERQTDSLSLVSAQCSGSCSNELASGGIDISGNGAFVTYSTRRRLLASDAENEYDVWVLDLANDTLSHESLNSADDNGTHYWGSNCFNPKLSATGEYVSFTSPARNLDTPEITMQNFHAYVKDRISRELTRVSVHDGTAAPCRGTYHATGASAPFVSATGVLAAFHSACPYQLPSGEEADTNGLVDVFVRNIATGSTTRASVASDGSEANGDSYMMGMSDDGRFIAFASDADNLVSDDTNNAQDLFVHDMLTRTTRRVSLGPGGTEIPSGIERGRISRNGRFVVFVTTANLLPTDTNTDTLDVYMVQLF